MGVDPDTAIGGAGNRFPSTQLSLIEAAGGGLPNDATARIIELYWKPVYAFIRFKYRKDNEAAKDLTQGFFAGALQRDFFARFDPGKAGFRTYLRMAVERFAANEHAAAGRQKRGGEIEFAELDENAAAGESPEDLFFREWRRQLYALSLDDLREHCAAAGKLTEWRVFEAYDLAEGERPSYAGLARLNGIPETSVTNYLAWARRTLRALLLARLRGVTSGESEAREELRRLWS
jgi:RNA polymerase sigma-70 factor (ECF subfamily)